MDTRPIPQAKSVEPERERLADSVSLSELVEQVSGFLRRQYPIFVFVIACSIAFGLLYLFTTPARYTAHAMLLIDSSKARALQQTQQPAALGDIPIDTAQVETQVEILKSESIGLSVIKDQRLTEDPEFVGTGGGLFGAILRLTSNLFGAELSNSSQPRSELQLSRSALGVFLRQRTVTRVARTYVLDIGYTSLSPGRAAGIANAIADAYIVDQLESKYQTTRRASAWLQDRLTELRTQALAADRAVLEFKEKNNIVTVDTGSGGNKLLGEQQLAEATTQLTAARGATGEAQARLDRITEVMKHDVADAAVADSLHNEVINRLRNNYLDLSAREAIWSARYGSTHLAAVNLRTQMDQLRRSINDELGRIAESYKSDYEIAKARQEALEKSFADLISNSQVINRDRLGLRQLESSAQVYHTIYDNFLQRYMEAIQQQSFPITEARVISTAAPPSGKSSPITFSVLALAVVLGVILSSAAAVLREAVDRVFRTTRQVEEILRTNCLAVLPALKGPASAAPASGGGRGSKVRSETTETGKRLFAASHRAFLRQVVDEPLSSFAEAFRSIKVAVDISGAIRENKVIGVTSTLPKEGKSTVACNLAELAAHAGKRVILVDADLRNPTLTRSLGSGAEVGLLQVLAGKVGLDAAVYTDEGTGLAMLPAVIESRLAHTNEILASEAFKKLIDQLRQAYDYIIVDLPPLAPVVDVRATTGIIDSYVYVIEWGRTRMNIVQHQLAGAPELYERLLGVVLNKANVRVLERYEYYYGRYYYKRYYARYGYAD
jgi:succinoglycan biosynthesis transport protein ExoP